MMSWKATRADIAADGVRLAAYRATSNGDRDLPGWLSSGFVTTSLYRIAHYLHSNGWRLTARFVWLVNICLTGADIGPSSRIGGGMLVPHPRGVTVYGNLGANCTLLGQIGVGGGVLNGPKGLPTIGDDVTLLQGTVILGPVTIGRGARLGPRVLFLKDVPEGGEVLPLEWRLVPNTGR